MQISYRIYELVSARNCNVKANLLYLRLLAAQGALLLFQVAQKIWTLLRALSAALPFHTLNKQDYAPIIMFPD